MPPDAHEDALRNYRLAHLPESKLNRLAHLPESKLRYALRDPDKGRLFEAIGFSEEAGDWRELYGDIVANLPRYPAVFKGGTRWGNLYYVDLHISGSAGSAP